MVELLLLVVEPWLHKMVLAGKNYLVHLMEQHCLQREVAVDLQWNEKKELK